MNKNNRSENNLLCKCIFSKTGKIVSGVLVLGGVSYLAKLLNDKYQLITFSKKNDDEDCICDN